MRRDEIKREMFSEKMMEYERWQVGNNNCDQVVIRKD